MPRSRIACIVAIAILITAFRHSTGVVRAQSATGEGRRFDVASVKLGLSPAEVGRRNAEAAANGRGYSFSVPIRMEAGGRFLGTATLKQLIGYAFDVRDYQIEGGPTWLTNDYFDVNAVAGFDATAEEMRGLVRTLLSDRFHLRSHIETRQAPVYVMTLSRSDGGLGPRLKQTTPECLQQIEQRKDASAVLPPPLFTISDSPSTTPRCGSTTTVSRAGALTLMMGGSELTSLVRQISNEVKAPVLDQTGLSGLYDMTLEYASDRGNSGRSPGLDPNGTDTPPIPLVPALQQQLGIRLDRQIGPMAILVVDGAEPPTPD
jgi:uncharacterized protein (TIGR03435 family)